jgi:hypothetical protein
MVDTVLADNFYRGSKEGIYRVFGGSGDISFSSLSFFFHWIFSCSDGILLEEEGKKFVSR